MTGLGKDDKRRRRLVLAGLLALTCVLGTRGIRDESSVMLGGDMARYVMNGVFIRDLIADGGVTSYAGLARYAERYYAKYPRCRSVITRRCRTFRRCRSSGCSASPCSRFGWRRCSGSCWPCGACTPWLRACSTGRSPPGPPRFSRPT